MPELIKKVAIPTVLLVILIFVGFLTIILPILFFAMESKMDHQCPIPYDYGIVIDAGSSHSGIFLYDWKSMKVNKTGFVRQIGKGCTVKPGISSYIKEPERAGESLKSCLDTLTQYIPPSDEKQKVVISLGATAGMRLVYIADAADSKRLMNSVESYLKSYKTPNNENFDVHTVSILDGTIEGANGWISPNYVLRSIPPDSPVYTGTVGILDMGGASAQIAFELDKSDSSFADVTTTLFGRKYPLSTYSNLCFGKEELIKRYHTMLIYENENNIFATGENLKEVKDPCLNSGLFILSPGSKLKTVCTSPLNEKILFNYTYKFVASVDVELCQTKIRKLLDDVECKKNFNLCPRKSNIEPPEEMSFFAISSYAYFMNAMKVINEETASRKMDGDEFIKLVEQWCLTKNDTLIQLINGSDQAKQILPYINEYCFVGYFIYYALIDLYKFSTPLFKNIQFTNKIGGSNIGWSLGFMLNETNIIPGYESKDWSVSSIWFVSFFGIGLIIILFSAINLSYLFIWKRRGYLKPSA